MHTDAIPSTQIKVLIGNTMRTVSTPEQADELAEALVNSGNADFARLAAWVRDTCRVLLTNTPTLSTPLTAPISLVVQSSGTGTLLWFDDSPNVGDPDCLCSACYLPIKQTLIPILRVWNEAVDPRDVLEMRFHHACIPPESGFHFRAHKETETEESLFQEVS